MGLLNKIFRSDKIEVQFIDDATGETIGISKMNPDQLPASFAEPTTIQIQQREWSVLEAIPQHSVEFLKTGKLTLKVKKIDNLPLQDLLFTLPTISNEIPMTVDNSLYNDFEVSIHDDDWRQNEFLKTSSLPFIEIEVSKIKAIWANESKEVDDKFTAFKNCHVRNTIGEPALSIDFDELRKLLNVNKIGSLKINGGFVLNGFSLQTEHTTYYGVVADGKVDHFCITKWSEGTRSELMKIIKHFQLVFAGWYHPEIVTP